MAVRGAEVGELPPNISKAVEDVSLRVRNESILLSTHASVLRW
jgi:hypothetical protein